MSDLVNRLIGLSETASATLHVRVSMKEAADRISQLERELAEALAAHKLELDLRFKSQAKLTAEKALSDRLSVVAEVAASYVKGLADADGGLDICDIAFRSDYDAAISSVVAHRKSRGL